ncbi:hypothetical protein BaRGS_00015690 [Batillaria attramentaria]|uniref:BRICHOS domain-containing protein n=1 Tax=Batillaria attramentaria TaxID=370345 RepID=A0ABD0L0Q2_9CAEN
MRTEICKHDPLPEKQSSDWADVTVAVEGQRVADQFAAARRRQQKRCRLACCASISFILILMLALGTACLVYRIKHRKGWRSFCGTRDDRVPEHVSVDHDNKLITVRPEHDGQDVMEIMHEYNRRLIAFRNATEKVCYIDRLDETFEDGYARWQGYEEREHKPDHHMRVVPTPIEVEVVKHIAGLHIYAHCGQTQVQYFWVVETTEIGKKHRSRSDPK